jgi:ubiquinone/menaquinone biosynthesis C-methylase UbiE
MSNDAQHNDSAEAYAALARFYDLQHAAYTPDVRLYLHFAAQCRQRLGDTPILELGCGTGRVMAPLTEAGYRVVGVDESPQMLQIAQQRLADAAPALYQLIQADARTLDMPDKFGMSFVALNTFLHNLTREHQLAMLATCHHHLLPGGLLIIDLPPNDELACQPDDGEFEYEATLVDPASDALIDKYVASQVHWAEQMQVLSYRVEEKTLADTITHQVSFRLRHVFKHEMELLLLMSGFRDWQWYGDYDLSPYGEDSSRMVVVASA